MKAYIVFCSPAGTTRHVAEVIREKLEQLSVETVLFDLHGDPDLKAIISGMADLDAEDVCVYAGSPVYAGHAVPVVESFLSKLPKTDKCRAVPFVTWGAVSSGIALHEMGEKLVEKGYRLAGAARIGAVHSLMWRFSEPLGNTHPDESDDTMICEMVASVCSMTKQDSLVALQLSELAYQPESVHSEFKKTSIETARQVLPKKLLDEQLCTQCGICEQECPAAAISCRPFPEFGTNCMLCYNCVRLCPETAIKADFSKVEGWLKKKSLDISEKPLSRIFLPGKKGVLIP